MLSNNFIGFDENKEFLLIFRDEMWDLPKGKQEPDEEISKTALREVEEECGISGMDLEKLLCINLIPLYRLSWRPPHPDGVSC